MTLPDRDDLLHLLDQLGSSEDAAVLKAARTLDAQVRAAGLGWDDLLVTSPPLDDDEDDDEQDDLDDDEVLSLEEHAGFEPDPGSEDPSALLGMIEALLARGDLTAESRGELVSFRQDLGSGVLDLADQRYLKALHKRLVG